LVNPKGKGFELTACGKAVIKGEVVGKVATISEGIDEGFPLDNKAMRSIIDALWNRLGTALHHREIEAVIIALALCNYASVADDLDELVDEWKSLYPEAIYNKKKGLRSGKED
jgi:uncharacterized protein YpuA (DUF1002 family)